MSTVGDLIPSPAPFERALAAAMSDELPVPIGELLDAATTRPDILPFLAFGESVDLWFDDWPIERKRHVAARWLADYASIIGTRAAAVPFLTLVDAVLLDKISHPTRFVIGRSAIARTPIGHPAYVTRHLVKVETVRPRSAHVIGRTAIGRNPIKTPTREPLRRARLALAASKGPGTEYRVDFQHKRIITIADAVPIDGTYTLGQHVDRVRL